MDSFLENHCSKRELLALLARPLGVRLLQALRDRAGRLDAQAAGVVDKAGAADRPGVDLDHRAEFAHGAGGEHLVGGLHLGERDAALLQWDVELLAIYKYTAARVCSWC